MDGFLNVHKPGGMTSHDVVQRIRKLMGEKQVGHGGTLDPFATGVLVVALGFATRLLEFKAGPKVYRAEAKFGVTTDTYDATGTVVEYHDVATLDRSQIKAACQHYLGEYLQHPPPFSARKYRGKPLYHYARKGLAVAPEPRSISIFRLHLVAWDPPSGLLEVTCSPGAYVRSLAHDLGQRLGCGAHLTTLVRLQDGDFRLEESVTLEALEAAFRAGSWRSLLYPPDLLVRDWPTITLAPPQDQEVLHGNDLWLKPEHVASSLRGVWSDEGGEEGCSRHRCRAYTKEGVLLALLEYQPEKGCWHAFKVFPPKAE